MTTKKRAPVPVPIIETPEQRAARRAKWEANKQMVAQRGGTLPCVECGREVRPKHPGVGRVICNECAE